MESGQTESDSIRVVHLGDLHFWAIPLNPLLYFNKRFLGVGNLVVGGRAKKFRQHLAPILIQKIQENLPDLFLFSGDFTSTSARSEFLKAKELLSPVLSGVKNGALFVPGNHDCYTYWELKKKNFVRHLGDVFSPVQDVASIQPAPGLMIIGINATTANGLGSHGAISELLLEKLKTALKAEHNLSSLWILCHFPAEDPPQAKLHNRGPQLRNFHLFFEKLKAFEIPILWLHGHHHHRWLYRSPSLPNLTYLNAGAPFLSRGGEPDLGFHELIYTPEELDIVTHWYSHQQSGWSLRRMNLSDPFDYVDLQES